MENEYTFSSNGELYHWKKKDAKYINREWKKGRWVYTYPSDTKGKSGKAAIEFDRKVGVDKKKQSAGVVGKRPVSNTSKKTYGNVSKEYLAELEYNSKKNEYPQKSTSGTSGKKSENRIEKHSQTVTPTNNNASKEYLAELGYNSMKNVYPKNTQTQTKTVSKAEKKSWLNKIVDSIKDAFGVDEKDAFEKLERDCEHAAEKERTTAGKYREANANFKKDRKSKEFGEKLWSTWEDWRKAVDEKKAADDARDEAFEKYLKTPIGALSNVDILAKRSLESAGKLIDDAMFEVEYAADQVKDWVSDRVDDLQDATIGKARDWYGYDELAVYNEAKRAMDSYREGREDALEKMSSDMRRLNKDPGNEDAAQDLDTSMWWYNYWDKRINDYQVDYTYAKTKYELTPKARIDNWVENQLENLEDWWGDTDANSKEETSKWKNLL